MEDDQGRSRWDLDLLFPGGSRSAAFNAFLAKAESEAESLLESAPSRLPAEVHAVAHLIARLQELEDRVQDAVSFARCLRAENAADPAVLPISARVRRVQGALRKAWSLVDASLVSLTDDNWHELLGLPGMSQVAWNLVERRDRAKTGVHPDIESLIQDLAVDGYHAWTDLFDLVNSRMVVRVEGSGFPDGVPTSQLPVSQLPVSRAMNLLADPDPNVRGHVKAGLDAARKAAADLCALALNRLAGFRLAEYRRRGWESPLQEPLRTNRVSRQTLDAVWTAVESGKPRLTQYLARRAAMAGAQAPRWEDLRAPVGGAIAGFSLGEARDLVVSGFERFSPRMAALAERAFHDRWIDARVGPGRQAGAFHAAFPGRSQSRIFLNFAGTMGNVSGMAHEIGHAYHLQVAAKLPALARSYPTCVAETASTLAELLVSDARATRAESDLERLSFAADALRRVVSLFMGIHGLYLFETRFYEERGKGIVPAERLAELMLASQREAYHDSLSSYSPYEWVTTRHLFLTDTPFYNFPYTLGFLISAALYARAIQDRRTFDAMYCGFLEDTGRMSVEDLIRTHLGSDPGSTAFWSDAVDVALKDLDQFMALSASCVSEDQRGR